MNVLPVPSKLKVTQIDYWVEEEIWGHRFYNDQTPWLIFLEFLAVLRDQVEKGEAFKCTSDKGDHEDFTYSMPLRLPLRFLLFNNPYLHHVEVTEEGNDAQWDRWLHIIKSSAVERAGVDFTYLRQHFEYRHLVRVAEVFQASAIGADSGKRWTSKFVYPHGPDCLFSEVSDKAGSKSRDRRFFARGGELLYLMLTRSGYGEQLLPMLQRVVLDENKAWNRMAKALLPRDQADDITNPAQIGYLPYAQRPEYGDLANDWISLLRLNMPGESVLDPLVRISSLHILRYLFNRAHEVINDGTFTRFVLEITAPKSTPIRALSADNYSANRRLTENAIEQHLKSFKATPEWRNASETLDADSARMALRNRFGFENKSLKGADGNTPDKVFNNFFRSVKSRHQQHFSSVPGVIARHIGLAVHRRGMKTRYAPTDALLKAVVFATVDGPMEFNVFLRELYRKYRFVIGANEAREAFDELPIDKRVFDENAQRLESRLLALGLLRRLSDDCAYVINAFGGSRG